MFGRCIKSWSEDPISLRYQLHVENRLESVREQNSDETEEESSERYNGEIKKPSVIHEISEGNETSLTVICIGDIDDRIMHKPAIKSAIFRIACRHS